MFFKPLYILENTDAVLPAATAAKGAVAPPLAAVIKPIAASSITVSVIIPNILAADISKFVRKLDTPPAVEPPILVALDHFSAK